MRYIRAECRSCFDNTNFAAENIACGPSTECMKRRGAGDGRTKIHNIKTARIDDEYCLCGACSGSLQIYPYH